MMNARRLSTISILVSLSMTLFLLESLLPVPFLLPGAKLGLSNIIIVYALYVLPNKVDALFILIVRIALSSMFAGSPSVILFSLSGGLLSFAAMSIFKASNSFSIIAVSAAGGFFHNVGQIIVASFIMQTSKVFMVLSLVGVCGIVTGVLIGFIASKVLTTFIN